jgi:hypothetical protein
VATYRVIFAVAVAPELQDRAPTIDYRVVATSRMHAMYLALRRKEATNLAIKTGLDFYSARVEPVEA